MARPEGAAPGEVRDALTASDDMLFRGRFARATPTHRDPTRPVGEDACRGSLVTDEVEKAVVDGAAEALREGAGAVLSAGLEAVLSESMGVGEANA